MKTPLELTSIMGANCNLNDTEIIPMDDSDNSAKLFVKS
jgi:hypothetical protein